MMFIRKKNLQKSFSRIINVTFICLIVIALYVLLQPQNNPFINNYSARHLNHATLRPLDLNEEFKLTHKPQATNLKQIHTVTVKSDTPDKMPKRSEKVANSISERLSKLNTNDNQIVEIYILIDAINKGEPFKYNLNYILNYIDDTEINKLANILLNDPTANYIYTNKELLADYEIIEDETYKKTLIETSNVLSWLNYVLNQFFYISYRGSDVIANSGNIHHTLNNVRLYIMRDQLDEAYKEFLSIDATLSVDAQKWIRNLNNRLYANKLIKLLKLKINNMNNN